jgi:Arrestin (or S-antigen), N-terminal domain.
VWREKSSNVLSAVLNVAKQNMGLKKFQIVFDNPWSTYYSGQPVTGKLLLTVDSPKKIRGMYVNS